MISKKSKLKVNQAIRIKSKDCKLNEIQANSNNEGTNLHSKNVLNKTDLICIRCNSKNLSFFTKTEEEIVYQCTDCKTFNPIPYDTSKLRFYFL